MLSDKDNALILFRKEYGCVEFVKEFLKKFEGLSPEEIVNVLSSFIEW